MSGLFSTCSRWSIFWYSCSMVFPFILFVGVEGERFVVSLKAFVRLEINLLGSGEP